MTGSLLEGMRAYLDAAKRLGERHPNIRVGSRRPIRSLTRKLVYGRDNYRCVWCGWEWDLQLDHVVPWSAGGADWSENLRTLCGSCNASRSNFIEPAAPRIVPVTVVCDPCLMNHDDSVLEIHACRTKYWRHCGVCLRGAFDAGEERITAWCGTCTATSWSSTWERIL